LDSRLGITADQIGIYMQNGATTSAPTDPGLLPPDTSAAGFALSYDARIFVVGYTGAVPDLMFVLSEWVCACCYGLSPDKAITFDGDIMDDRTADLDILISGITETYTLDADRRVVPVPEPNVADLIHKVMWGGDHAPD
jgi:hypothetical protein